MCKNSSVIKASDALVVGKNNIGYVSSDFTSRFGQACFEEGPLGKFQKLGKYMENAEAIEKELKPGKCTLADVYAFLKNPPEGTKDGYYNLFLVDDMVVSVYWHSGFGFWDVGAWGRGRHWSGGNRVFSPGLGSQTLEPVSLKLAIEICKENGYQVVKVM